VCSSGKPPVGLFAVAQGGTQRRTKPKKHHKHVQAARRLAGELGDDLEAFNLGEAGYHGTDWHPPDVKVRVAGAPGTRTRIETPALLGRKPALVPDQSLMDGINAGRKTIPFARFDKKRTAQGLEGLCHVRAFYLSTPLRHSRTA